MLLCQLCKRMKPFLIARVEGKKLRVCTFCAIVKKLEVLEAISVQEQERLEKRLKARAELYLSSMQQEGDEQDFEHPPYP
jgi:ribosome-binding protein aMBF1 (putative translation factor)